VSSPSPLATTSVDARREAEGEGESESEATTEGASDRVQEEDRSKVMQKRDVEDIAARTARMLEYENIEEEDDDDDDEYESDEDYDEDDDDEYESDEELDEDTSEEELDEDEFDEDGEDASEDASEEDVDAAAEDKPIEAWTEVYVSEALRRRRSSLEDGIKQAMRDVDASVQLHPHQRSYAELLARRFCEGRPGAILNTDPGFGKTHTALFTAGALVQNGVRVIYASEPLLVEETRALFDAMWPALKQNDAFRVVQSGQREAHYQAMKSALAPRRTDDDGSDDDDHVVVFLDEAMRYSNVAGGSMYKSIANATNAFKVLITATPFTSTFSRLASTVALTGIVEPSERAAFLRAFGANAEDFVKHVAEGKCVNAHPITTVVNSVTVGKRALEAHFPDVARAISRDVLARARIERDVLVIPNFFCDDPFFDVAMHTAGKDPSKALSIIERLELSSHMANDIMRAIDSDRRADADAVVDVIVKAIVDVVDGGQPVVVFVPSTIAAFGWFTYSRLRGMLGPCRVAFINEQTKPVDRRRFIDGINTRETSRVLDVVFLTTETSGFGINIPSVDRAFLLTSSWTSSSNVQALMRIVRPFSDDAEKHPSKHLTTVMITSSKGSLALTRFSRAATRGKIANLLFPTYLVDPTDELPLALATTPTRLSSESRQELSDAYSERVEMLKYGQSCVIAYGDFIRDASRFVDETGQFSDFHFVLKGQEEYPGRAFGGSRKKKTVAAPRERTARVAGATEGIQSILKPIKPRNDEEVFVLAGVAAPLPSRMSPNDVDRCATVANEIAKGIEKAKEALQNGEQPWRPSLSARFEYLFPKTIDPESPERRFMLTASMLDPARMKKKKKKQDEAQEPTLPMQAGIEFEPRALRLVAEKYGFQMVPEADKFSRCLPSNPTYMAATLDGLTTTGVVVELKFVTNFVDLLTQQAMVQKYSQHWHQVQGELTAYELPLALLVFYSVDGETDEMCSMEFWVQRDEHYLRDNKKRFDLWLKEQRKPTLGYRQDLL
jgi:superfamily II DNA or RNA helicase